MHIVEDIYQKCLTQVIVKIVMSLIMLKNFTLLLLRRNFRKMERLLSPEDINAEVEIIYQTIETFMRPVQRT